MRRSDLGHRRRFRADVPKKTWICTYGRGHDAASARHRATASEREEGAGDRSPLIGLLPVGTVAALRRLS